MLSIYQDGSFTANDIDEVAVTDSLLCNPSPFTLTEWPDGANTYLQGTLSTDAWTGWSASGITSGTASVTAVNGNLVFQRDGTGAYAIYTVALPIGTNVKVRLKVSGGSSSIIRLGGSGTLFTVIDFDIGYDTYSIISGNVSAIGASLTISSANRNVNESQTITIDWIYVGDGSYTSKALDASGNGYGTTVAGATPISTTVGRGFSFDGVNDQATFSCPQFTTDNSFTVSTWFNVPAVYSWSTGGYGSIFGVGISAGSFGIWRYSTDNVYTVGLRDSVTNRIVNTNVLLRDISYLLTLSYNGSTRIGDVYLNGSLIGSTAQAISGYTLDTSGILGGSVALTGVSNYYQGIIADPRIYSKALSATEVKQLYKLGAP